MEHSFQVIKTDLPPDKLPTDGASAKAKEDGKVGEIASIPAGKSAAVTVDLAPGKYVYRSDRHKALRGSFTVSSTS